jgi:hypothetical protein
MSRSYNTVSSGVGFTLNLHNYKVSTCVGFILNHYNYSVSAGVGFSLNHHNHAASIGVGLTESSKRTITDLAAIQDGPFDCGYVVELARIEDSWQVLRGEWRITLVFLVWIWLPAHGLSFTSTSVLLLLL